MFIIQNVYLCNYTFLEMINTEILPFLKWMGDKRDSLSSIRAALPRDFQKLTYFEPFVGGGSVLFALQPDKAFINDLNGDLIHAYNVVKDYPEALLDALSMYVANEAHYYHMRNLERNVIAFAQLGPVERAARFIFLNKTCFNGLYRVNADGYFNVPYGGYKNPCIINPDNIRAISAYLKEHVSISYGDYSKVVVNAGSGSFVYLDPPNFPISNNLTASTQEEWDEENQRKLRDLCLELDGRGVRFLLSSTDMYLIRSLFHMFKIEKVKSVRGANSCGAVNGLLIRNYRK